MKTTSFSKLALHHVATTTPPGAPSPSQAGPRTVSPLLTIVQQPQSPEPPVALGLAGRGVRLSLRRLAAVKAILSTVPSPWRVLPMVAFTANCEPSTTTSSRRASTRSGASKSRSLTTTLVVTRPQNPPAISLHVGGSKFRNM